MHAPSPVQNRLINTIAHGNCIDVMRQLPANSVDFILTDPPYMVSYKDRDGRSILNDSDDSWLKPAFAEAYRALMPNSFCISFYGWTRVDRFLAAWKAAGFRVVEHMVFVKRYASKARFLRYQHEQAYLLAKGNPELPVAPLSDVIEMKYSGNKLHPTQKPVAALIPLIQAFSEPGDLVLDPFLRLRLYLRGSIQCGPQIYRHRTRSHVSANRADETCATGRDPAARCSFLPNAANSAHLLAARVKASCGSGLLFFRLD